MQIDRRKLTVFISGLPYSWTAETLADFLAERGYDVNDMRLTHHKPEHPKFPGKFNGGALVEFKTEEDAKYAIDCLHGSSLQNKEIRVEPAKITLFRPAPRRMTEKEYFESIFLNTEAA